MITAIAIYLVLTVEFYAWLLRTSEEDCNEDQSA